MLIFLFYPYVFAGNLSNLPVRMHNGVPYVSYNTLIERYNLSARYDEVAGRLVLFKDDHMSVFTISGRAAIIDGLISRSDYPVSTISGEVFIPIDMVNDFTSSFDRRTAVVPEPKIEVEEVKTTFTLGDKIDFIVIDAGHGGRDPGAVSKSGVREKDITLSIGNLVAAELRKQLKDTEIILTRRNDTFIELERRTNTANSRLRKNSNGIFVSIHINASLSDKISGIETYFLSQNPSNEEARQTAARENNAVRFESSQARDRHQNSIDYIEARMMTTQIQRESELLANLVQKSLIKNLNGFKDRGVKKADFFVLRGALMPAVLVEVGYITNAEDLARITQRSYQDRAAKAISEGIINFITEYNKSID